MGNYFDLIAAINAAIKTNGEQGITGASLNAILRDMVAALGAGYQYVGVVTPDAAAPSTDYNAVYLGLTAGTYTNFGGTQVRGGQFGVFTFNGSWTYNIADIASGGYVRYDASQVMTQEQAAQARSNIAAASNADVNQLGQKVDGINLSDITYQNARIDISSPQIVYAAGYTYRVFPVVGGAELRYSATNNNGFRFYIVKSFTFNPVLPYNLDLATGETGIRNASTGGNIYKITLPNDALYLVSLGNPTLLEINGRNIIESLEQIVVKQGEGQKDIFDDVKDVDVKFSQLLEGASANQFFGDLLSSSAAIFRSTTRKYCVIKVSGGVDVNYKRINAPSTYFYVVKSFSFSGEYPITLDLATGETGYHGIPNANRDYTLTLPSDAAYIIMLSFTTESVIPEVFLVDGEDVITGCVSDYNAKIAEIQRELSSIKDDASKLFLETSFGEGVNLVPGLQFQNKNINSSGVISNSSARLLSAKVSGKEGILVFDTLRATADLKLFWYKFQEGSASAKDYGGWYTDESKEIKVHPDFYYYFLIAKVGDSAIVPGDLAGVEIRFSEGDIIKCNRDTIAKLGNMRRPFHNYSASGTYNDCLALVHFSDVHASTENIRRIAQFCSLYGSRISDVIQTGDLIGSNLSDGVPANWASIGKNILGVIGNHDAQNKVGNVWVTQPQKDSYDSVFAPFIANWGVMQPEDAETDGLCYWYKDYAGQNIRVVGLDCMHWDSAQKTWFEGVLAEAKTASLSVIVAVHYLPFQMRHTNTAFDSKDFTPTTSTGDFFASPEIANAVSEHMTNGGKFICYITGHVHIDLFGVGESYPEQLCISIACAAAGLGATIYGDTERVVGTKSEDCMNVLAFDTTSKTIKILRIGVEHDRYMRTKDFLSFNYDTKEII